MFRATLVLGVAAAMAIVCANHAQASGAPVTRTPGMRSNGARGDMTVPYLTTWRSAFMSGYVAPRIYASPIVDDIRNPQAKPVFNLIFYGSREGFGDRSNGATPRTR
jgi:hypothetical protein